MFGGLKTTVTRAATFSATKHQDINAFYAIAPHSKLTIPKLTTMATWIMGAKRYPFSALRYNEVIGKGMTRTHKVNGQNYYEYPLNMRGYNPLIIAKSSALLTASDRGLGHKTFQICLTDNRPGRSHVIRHNSGVSLRITQDPIKIAEGWMYTVQLISSNPAAACPAEVLEAGQLWAIITNNIAEHRDYGPSSTTYYPGKGIGSIAHFGRHATWGGLDALDKNRVLEFAMQVVDENGKTDTFTHWMPYFLAMFEKDWNDEQEKMYMFSKSNLNPKTLKPTIYNQSGEPVYTFDGIMEQIPTVLTYNTLTYDVLVNLITRHYLNKPELDNGRIDVFGGRGAQLLFDKILKTAVKDEIDNFSGIGDKFVHGSDYGLQKHGYFDTFYHFAGYILRFKHVPALDRSEIAAASPLHPETGLPVESHRMIFLPTNGKDGAPNIYFVEKEDAPQKHWLIMGSTDAPAGIGSIKSVTDSNPPERTQIADDGSYYRQKSIGIHIEAPDTCLMLEYGVSF